MVDVDIPTTTTTTQTTTSTSEPTTSKRTTSVSSDSGNGEDFSNKMNESIHNYATWILFAIILASIALVFLLIKALMRYKKFRNWKKEAVIYQPPIRFSSNKNDDSNIYEIYS